MKTHVALFAVSLVMAAPCQGQTPSLNLSTAVGTVEKVEGQTLLLRVGSSTSKSTRRLTLHIAGTSKINTLVRRITEGKLVLSQRELPVDSLKPDQQIAVVYTRIGTQPILLNGVVKPLAQTDSKKK